MNKIAQQRKTVARLKPAPRLARVLIARLKRHVHRGTYQWMQQCGLLKLEDVAVDGTTLRRWQVTDVAYLDGQAERQLNAIHAAARAAQQSSPGSAFAGRFVSARRALDIDAFDDDEDEGLDGTDEETRDGEAGPKPTPADLVLAGLEPSARAEARYRLLAWMRELGRQPLPSDIAACILVARALEKFDRAELKKLLGAQDRWVLLTSGVGGLSKRADRLIKMGVLETNATLVPFAASETRDSLLRAPMGLRVHDPVNGLLAARAHPVKGLGGIRDGLHLVLTDSLGSLPVQMVGVIDTLLDAGNLSLSTLAHTISAVTGCRPTLAQRTLRRLVMREGFDPTGLGLSDLDFAIRSGRSLDDIGVALSAIARDKSDEASAYDPAEAGLLPTRPKLSKQSPAARLAALRETSVRNAVQASAAEKSSSRARKSASSNRGAASLLFLPDSLRLEIEQGSPGQARQRLSKNQLRDAMATGNRSVEAMHGLGEAKDWAVDLKSDLELWWQGSLDWTGLSSRLLLSGPPGCGKTTYAKALGNTLSLPVFASSVSTWLERGHLGDVLEQAVQVFGEARAAAPAILFIDEIDALGTRQPPSHQHADYFNSIINRVLELLDGSVAQTGLIVVGATNRPEVLDPAIVRSGRLDRHVAIPMPDHAALKGIVRHYLGDDLDAVASSMASLPSSAIACQPPIERLLDRVALHASGRTGADIEKLVRDARREARRRDQALSFTIIERHLLGNRDSMNPDIAWHCAVHEAGHAIAIQELKTGTLTSLSLNDADGASTRFEGGRMERRRDQLDVLTTLMAGREAEKLLIGDCLAGSGGARGSDLAEATELALAFETRFGFGETHPLVYRPGSRHQSLIETDPDLAARVSRRLDEAAERAAQLLSFARPTIVALAEALRDEHVLSGDRARAIMSAARRDKET